ncbi:MAG: LPS export ABC transporter periplasmic protein LptC [Alphaproteobacteria bacterium]|nr:LPS export ABC transporter periplasmic protein LptC [Alphaproteobacteria bacterium]
MASPRLDSFNSAPPRRRLRALGAGYTWFVRIAKIALPLLALVLVGVVISRMSHSPVQRIAEMPKQTKQDKTTPGQIELVKARYEGVDAKGRAYSLTADHASRDMNAEEAVLLDNPKAVVTLQNGGALSAAALHGRYNHASGELELSDDVTLAHDSGYVMHLQNLSVDVKTRTAASNLPLTAEGPAGTLSAAALDVADQGELVTFTGPVRLTFSHVPPPAPQKTKGGPG